jgi:AraC-like DNA-binding protein
MAEGAMMGGLPERSGCSELSVLNGGNKLSTNVIDLLKIASRESEIDSRSAKRFIEQALSLLQSEVEESARSVDFGVLTNGLAVWQIRRVTAFIDAHLAAPIRISELSFIARLSKGYFSRAFKRSFGVAPLRYIVRKRLELARQLMMETDDSLTQVAAACGFADQAHFCKMFKQSSGKCPSLWRRERS